MCDEVKATLKKADAVCFDVDSTVIAEEGIDELAKFCGQGVEIARLTARAMCGNMTFQEALKLRLDILQPSLDIIKKFIEERPSTLSPNIDRLVSFLHNNGIPVYLVSGGFKCIIEPIALKLNIPLTNVYANRLKFYFNGGYAGFDETAPTSSTGGKALVVQELKRRYFYENLVFIGDGATDLEACPPANAFIGYGGNVFRQNIMEKAKWYVTDFNEILEILEESDVFSF